eukprot:Colp12_sorted_trinity150504_noHs@8089
MANEGGGEAGDAAAAAGKPRFRNRVRLEPSQLRKLTLVERARYLAYEPAPVRAQDAANKAAKRIHTELAELKKSERRKVDVKKEQAARELRGWEEAAKAEARILLRLQKFQEVRERELQHLIASQPTALKAVKLESLVPLLPPPKITYSAVMTERERIRAREIVESGARAFC